MTPLPARRVRRLLLSAPSEGLVQRARTAIEDGLRTASVPSVEPGRVLVVRRLNLGGIREGTSPSSIALIVEKRLAEARLKAVHADTAQADLSPAVSFRDASEPYVILAVRLARHAGVSSWYWPLVIPDWRPHLSYQAAWNVVLRALARSKAAPAAMLHLVQTLNEDRTLDELLAVLQPSDGAALLAACGWSPSAVASTPAAPMSVVVAPQRLQTVVSQWVANWGPADPRSAWLAAISVAIERPAALADPHFPVRALLAITTHSLAAAGGTTMPPSPRATIARTRTTTPQIVGEVRENPEEPSDPPDQGAFVQDRGEADDQAERHWPGPHRPVDPMPTAFGGFYFLLSLLHRLRLDTLLEQRPELLDADFPNHLLRYAADRLQIPPEDPVRLPLIEPPPSPPEPDVVPQIEMWFRSMRHWSRRHARIGLLDLTRRPAVVEVTRTHIDVSFGLHQVDMRVRRAGLDIDPGWIPWLGHVVMFHYLDAPPRTI